MNKKIEVERETWGKQMDPHQKPWFPIVKVKWKT